MEKAYDPKALLAELKDNGLELAEDAAETIIEAMFSWIEKSAKLSPTVYDDMALIVLPQLKILALKAADNINPADNQDSDARPT